MYNNHKQSIILFTFSISLFSLFKPLEKNKKNVVKIAMIADFIKSPIILIAKSGILNFNIFLFYLLNFQIYLSPINIPFSIFYLCIIH